jgi:serine/threonine-protein kinase
MHRRQVYHGDLKPNNILVSRTGEVKVIDFGLARIRGEESTRITGTPEYMAPEQVKNSMVNERTDVFNFGAAMYRMVTWRLPPSVVPEEAGGGILTAKLWDRVLKPVESLNPNVPPALRDLIHRCLAYDAKQRPERMSEVQGALDHLVDELVRAPEDRLEALEW